MVLFVKALEGADLFFFLSFLLPFTLFILILN